MKSKIAILGWGSLILDPRTLSISGDWQSDGPVLEIEFSRISNDGRLTLVIDLASGTKIKTLYVESAYNRVEDAACDLMAREGTGRNNIGVVSKRTSENQIRNHPEILPLIQKWLNASSFDSVIWTDLKSNYLEKRDINFSIDDAYEYLEGLPPVCKDNARK